jgi:hypothetical protein
MIFEQTIIIRPFVFHWWVVKNVLSGSTRFKPLRPPSRSYRRSSAAGGYASIQVTLMVFHLLPFNKRFGPIRDHM